MVFEKYDFKKSVKNGISPLAEFANFQHLLNILRKHIALGDVAVKALRLHWLMAYQWKAIVHIFLSFGTLCYQRAC